MSIGPTVRRRRLGSELRHLREAQSIKLEEVADRLGLAASTLSRIETGKAPTRTAYLSAMLDLYGVQDTVQRQPGDRPDGGARAGHVHQGRSHAQVGVGLLQLPGEPAQREAVHLGAGEH